MDARFYVLAQCGLAALAATLLTGCGRGLVNPSFAISRTDARQALDAMAADRKPFERPVVVLGGYHDPGLGPGAVCGRLRRAAGGQRVIGVSYFFEGSFDACRRRVIAAVERAFPSHDPRQTIELDVIGLSMGGVVGRYCAIDKPGEKRLRIRRLFTISSPHRGAAGASEIPAMSQLHRDLREGSKFLDKLEAAEGEERGYEIVPYVRLGDWIVGQRDAAPPGMTAWWVDTPAFENAHVGAALDPRILADVVRRLRGEEPITRMSLPTALSGKMPATNDSAQKWRAR